MAGIVIKERALGKEFEVWDYGDDIVKAEKDLATIKRENPKRDVYIDKSRIEQNSNSKEDCGC